LTVAWETLFRRVPRLRPAVPVQDISFFDHENIVGVHELPATR